MPCLVKVIINGRRELAHAVMITAPPGTWSSVCAFLPDRGAQELREIRRVDDESQWLGVAPELVTKLSEAETKALAEHNHLHIGEVCFRLLGVQDFAMHLFPEDCGGPLYKIPEATLRFPKLSDLL